MRMVEQQSMKLELQTEWMGHPKGSVLQILKPKAEEMMSRGVAKEVKKDEKTKLQKREQDKMVKSSKNK